MPTPRLRVKVKSLLNKARDSAFLAVSVYNNPTTVFRTYGFIVLMNIAWTSLFHAIFERNRVRYYYRDRTDRRRYERIEGDYKAWDLPKSAAVYFGDRHEPIRKNIEFFVGLRNKIEHRFAPEIDIDLFGECQAYLINFEQILVAEFGQNYAIADNLVYALQFSRLRTADQMVALKRCQSKHLKEIREYIHNFRLGLDLSILSDPGFALRVYLVQKIANHESSADAAIEFVKFDPKNPEEMKKYQHLVTIIREKQVPALPTSVSITTDRAEPHERVLLAERSNTDGLPLVGVTRDPEKASGVFVIEQLPEDFFDDAIGIVDAAQLFHRRFGEVNLSKRALYFTYAGRQKISSPDASKILAEASYNSYTTIYYWIRHMRAEDVLSFFRAAFSRMLYPKIRSVIRLLCATGPGPWWDHIVSLHNRIDHYSQKPSWYWFIDVLIERVAKVDHIYAALEAEPHHMIAGKAIRELVGNVEISEQLLSKLCLDFASKQMVDEASIKRLDLIVHFQALANLLLPPQNMPEVPVSSDTGGSSSALREVFTDEDIEN